MDINLTSPIVSNSFSSLVSYCSTNNIPLITGVDTNAHHTAWLSTDINTRGTALLDYLSTAALSWANTSNLPTFVSSRGSSLIDLTLLNPPALFSLDNWSLSNTPSLSDHRLITFDITVIGTSKKTKTRAFKRCNWDECRSILSSNFITSPPVIFRPNPSPAQLDAATKALTSRMVTAFTKACPVVHIANTKSSPWWNRDLSLSKSLAGEAQVQAINANTNAEWANYSNGLSSFRKLIRSSKRKSWKGFASSVTSTRQSARLAKILKQGNRKSMKLGSLIKADGSSTNSPSETLSYLTSTLFPSSSSPPPAPRATPSFYDTSIILSRHRIKKAVSSLIKGKAPGPDGIRPEMIIECWPIIEPAVTYIFSHSLKLGHIPLPWKHATGAIIPKPGKADYSSPRAFRIISLSSTLLKTLERLVLWNLQLDKKIPAALNKSQFGFTRGSSTEAAIHILTSKIEAALQRGDFALGIFLDIEGAFDNISFSAIHEALISAGVDPHISNWILALISTRTVTLSLASAFITILIICGCPQGGVLSPFLWNLVLDNLLNRFSTWPEPIQAFADDLALILIGIDVSTLISIAQEHINTCTSWCATKGLKISHIKTQIVLFTRRTKWSISRPLRINNLPVEFTTSAKYLGVTLDSRLSWTPHINAVTSSALNTLFACRKALGYSWGLSPKVSKFIFIAVVRPALAYCSFAWSHTLSSSSVKVKKFNYVQRIACLTITRGFPSTASEALSIISNIPPLKIFLDSLALMTRHRLITSGHWIKVCQTTPHSSHTYKLFILAKDIPEFFGPTDAISPILNLDTSFTVSIPNREDYDDFSFPPGLSLFTDGSKQGDLTGAGFCCYRDGIIIKEASFSLGASPSVFQTELHAISEACLFIMGEGFSSAISIFSDSQPAINAVSNTIIRSATVHRCLNLLTQAASSTEISLVWVPGHSGIQGNDHADHLARQGSLLTPIGPAPFLPLGNATLKSLTSAYFKEIHITQWEDNVNNISPKCHDPATSFLNLPSSKKSLPSAPASTALLTQLVTGHSYLHYFQWRTNMITSPTCPSCQEDDDTSEHFLGRCPAFTRLRMQFFNVSSCPLAYLISVFPPRTILAYASATDRELTKRF